MSNSKIFNSSDLGDAEGYQIGLFDRIINIKFTRADGSTFTLRSDYEPVWLGDRLFFKPCQPKPDIRVEYTQYNGTLLNVEIYVANLNIIENSPVDTRSLSTDVSAVSTSQIQGDLTNLPSDALTSKGNKRIIGAQIEMGYRGQFFDWSKYDGLVSPDVAYAAFQNLEQIQNLNNIDQNNRLAVSELANSQVLFQAYRRCNVVITWAVNTNNPPDKITHFHGYVGTAEAGLAPFAFQAMGDPSDVTAGTGAVLSTDDILDELDDKHKPIDVVFSGTEDHWSIPDPKLTGVRRNLFNGGKGFTLLEGFCFHMITRRFVRSNITMKRSSALEQAAVSYVQATKSPEEKKKIENEVLQKIYSQEVVSVSDAYIQTKTSADGRKEFAIADTAPASFKEDVETAVLEIIAAQTIGPRFTIKNLPEYRKLYLAIRNKLAEAANKKEYMSWWDAAASVQNITVTEATPQKAVNETVEDACSYTLALQNGELDNVDCYFDSLTGKDWIVPMQSMVNSAQATNHQGAPIQVKYPTQVSGRDFNTAADLQTVKCFTGLFEVRDAYLFGVPVLCSDRASAIFKASHTDKRNVTAQFFPDAQHQIDWICKTWDLRCYKLHNGGFYLYAATENARMTAGQTFVVEQSKKPFRIPAIYDMTLSPLRKIRMPFVGFLDPMTTVEWNSSSMIGEMVSFYYQPEKGKNFFTIIKSVVNFATVNDFNMMEMDVIDSQYTETPKVEAAITGAEKAKTDKNYFREVIIIPDVNMTTWKHIYNSFVTRIPTDKIPLWPSTETNKDMNITKDNRISNFQFFRQMYNWNVSLFEQAAVSTTAGSDWDDIKQRIDSDADRTYGNTRPVIEPNTLKPHFPNINYCMSKLPDSSLRRIYMRIPIMPKDADYENMVNIDDKRVYVYQNGAWYEYLKTDLPEYKIEAI